ncbi:hypothetical protein GCM10027612_19860 [Microbispora bryophytorum subsp. camponoti]
MPLREQIEDRQPAVPVVTDAVEKDQRRAAAATVVGELHTSESSTRDGRKKRAAQRVASAAVRCGGAAA